jgi:hypothetical protein
MNGRHFDPSEIQNYFWDTTPSEPGKYKHVELKSCFNPSDAGRILSVSAELRRPDPFYGKTASHP